MWQDIIRGILIGAFYGGQAALYGYLASEDLPVSWRAIFTKAFWEKFSWTKAGKTIFLGIIIGAISQGYNFIDPHSWELFTEATGLPQIPLGVVLNFAYTAAILGFDKFTKFIVRRTPLVKAWDKFKTWIIKVLTTRDQVKEYLEEHKEEPIPTPS